jgi:DNA-binding NarL/FixJ family response regulator
MPKLDGLRGGACSGPTAPRALISTPTPTRHWPTLRAGAKGYLLKDAAAEDVCRAIVRVAEGGMFLAPDVAAQYVQLSTRPELSQRELQILRMVGQGKPNKQIARDLSVEVTTVKGHVKSVFEKLGVRNRTEALAEATRRGMVSGSD